MFEFVEIVRRTSNLRFFIISERIFQNQFIFFNFNIIVLFKKVIYFRILLRLNKSRNFLIVFLIKHFIFLEIPFFLILSIARLINQFVNICLFSLSKHFVNFFIFLYISCFFFNCWFFRFWTQTPHYYYYLNFNFQ